LRPLRGGDSAEVILAVTAPAASGVYQLEVDVVQEGVRWFADVGSPIASVSVSVDPNAQVGHPVELPRAIVNNIDAAYTPAPDFEMHGIHRGRIEAIAKNCRMRLIRCDDYVTDWLSHEYVFAKLT
jgi:hypothetical protein